MFTSSCDSASLFSPHSEFNLFKIIYQLTNVTPVSFHPLPAEMSLSKKNESCEKGHLFSLDEM